MNSPNSNPNPNSNRNSNPNQALDIIGRTYRFKKGLLHYEDGARLIIYDGTRVVKVIPMTERMKNPSKILLVCAVGYFYFIATCIGVNDALLSEPTVSATIPGIVGRAFVFLLIAVAFVFMSFKSFDQALQRVNPGSAEVSPELLKRLSDAYRRGPYSTWFPYGHGPKEIAGMFVGFLLILVFGSLILFFPAVSALGLKQVYNVKAGDELYMAGDVSAAEKLYRENADFMFTGITTASVSSGFASNTYVSDATQSWERLALALARLGRNEEAATYLKQAIDKNVHWAVHPPKDSDNDFILGGYDCDDQAKKVARMLGNYCTLLAALGRQEEARTYAKDCWLNVFTSTTVPRRLKMLEKAAMRGAVKSLEARDFQQAAEELQAKQEELNISESTPPEVVLPLLIDSSLESVILKTNAIDDRVITQAKR